MSTPEDIWTTRLHAAVDDHPGALAFDVSSYVAAGRRRARRNRAAALVATAAAVAVVIAGAAFIGDGTLEGAPQPSGPADPATMTLGSGTNGWVAVDAYQGGGDVYVGKPGEDARRLTVAGSASAIEACPAWSPDGTRLVFGRVADRSEDTSGDAELVIVPIGPDGTAAKPTEIELDGFEVPNGHHVPPCGIWAPGGRWVALSGKGEVWVVDTQAGAIRRLPNLQPSDLEWRPGSDELAIAGDMGANRSAPTLSTPVTIYSVSTDESRKLSSAEAAHLTWSPDGKTLAYVGGETDTRELRLVDSDGTNERTLVADLGLAMHGIGPVWSPTGDRIAYQRVDGTSGEKHEVVLVDVTDGTETVINPPESDGWSWYPYTVTWSPDGTKLLYAGWGQTSGPTSTSVSGLIAVAADTPTDVTVLTTAIDPVPDYYSHRWSATQMWGRQLPK